VSDVGQFLFDKNYMLRNSSAGRRRPRREAAASASSGSASSSPPLASSALRAGEVELTPLEAQAQGQEHARYGEETIRQQQQQQQPLPPLLANSDGSAERALSEQMRAQMEVYGKKLQHLARSSSSSQRKYSLAWSMLILCLLAAVTIVIVFLITSSYEQDANSVSVREICNSDNVELCLEGLRDQLRDDTTAALRSPIHYIFTFAAFCLALLIYTCLLNRKQARKRRMLGSLPNDSVDLWNTSGKERRPYRTLSFNADLYYCVWMYLHRAWLIKRIQLIVASKEVTEGKLPCKDTNWGYVDGSGFGRKDSEGVTKVNFKHYTSKSFEFVSELAARANPEYKIQPLETVRDYMKRLQKEESEIDKSVCEEFVNLYEEAKFGNRSFDNSKWGRVRENLSYFHNFFR